MPAQGATGGVYRYGALWFDSKCTALLITVVSRAAAAVVKPSNSSPMNLAQEAQKKAEASTVRCARASPPRGPHARIAGRRATQRHPAREYHTASRGDDSSMPFTHTHIGEAHTAAATRPGGARRGPPAFCPRAHACILPRLRRRLGTSRSPQSHAGVVRCSLGQTSR